MDNLEADLNITEDPTLAFTYTYFEASSLYNSTGQIVFSKNQLVDFSGYLDLSFLSHGIYFLEVRLANSSSKISATSEIILPEKKIALYPNPSNGIVIVNFNINEIRSTDLESISVIDINGIISHMEQYINQGFLDLNHLTKGIYFVRFSLDNGTSYYEQLILK